MAAYDNGLRIYDISAPDTVKLVGSTGTLGNAAKVEIEGNIAYVYNTGSSFSLTMVDVSQPDRPTLLSNLPIPSAPSVGGTVVFLGIKVSGDRVYIPDPPGFLAGASGITVVDVSVPISPKILGLVGPGGFNGGVELLGDVIVAANREG